MEQVRYLTLIGAMPSGFFGVVFGRSFGLTLDSQALPNRIVRSQHPCTRRVDCSRK